MQSSHLYNGSKRHKKTKSTNGITNAKLELEAAVFAVFALQQQANTDNWWSGSIGFNYTTNNSQTQNTSHSFLHSLHTRSFHLQTRQRANRTAVRTTAARRRRRRRRHEQVDRACDRRSAYAVHALCVRACMRVDVQHSGFVFVRVDWCSGVCVCVRARSIDRQLSVEGCSIAKRWKVLRGFAEFANSPWDINKIKNIVKTEYNTGCARLRQRLFARHNSRLQPTHHDNKQTGYLVLTADSRRSHRSSASSNTNLQHDTKHTRRAATTAIICRIMHALSHKNNKHKQYQPPAPNSSPKQCAMFSNTRMPMSPSSSSTVHAQMREKETYL